MRKTITAIYYTIMGLLLARVIMSWVPALYDNPVGKTIYAITEPVLAPIRAILPPIAGFDLSVLVVWLVLRFVYGWLMTRRFAAEES